MHSQDARGLRANQESPRDSKSCFQKDLPTGMRPATGNRRRPDATAFDEPPMDLRTGKQNRGRARPRRATSLTLLAALLVTSPIVEAGSQVAKLKLKNGIAVHVPEVATITRTADPVTFAFPLRKKDKIKSVDKLMVVDANGDPVSSQMRVTQRWMGGVEDPKKAIRWVLVDIQVDVAADAEATYTVKKKKKADVIPDAPTLDVTSDAQGVHVDTGSAKYRLSATTSNFLDLVMADLDGDGVVEDGEKLIDQPANAGFVLTDRFGATYSSADSPVTLMIEEQGPLRTVVRADGLHEPTTPGGGINRDFFQYRTRYTFYAGKPYVRVQHTLRNAYLDDPLGDMGFEGYTLHTSLASGANAGGPAFHTRFGVDDGQQFITAGGASLYQDSDGGDQWDDSPDTTFRGFSIDDTGATQLATGDQAAGYMHVRSGQLGLTMAMADFFENFPKRFAYDGASGLEFDIFPEEFGTWHYLEDGQQKTTDFYVIPVWPGGPGFSAEVTRRDSPLHPYADPEWTRQTKAWADHGDLDTVDDLEAWRTRDDEVLAGVYSKAFQLNSYAFGWSEFGELTWAKSTHTTGSPRNRLSYFQRFVLTGSYSNFRVNELFALHSRDIRRYHIDGFSMEVRPDTAMWDGLPIWSHSDDQLGRDSLDPALDPHRDGIPYGGHGWNGFDIEHMVADDLYEHYVLTGDHVTLDSLKDMGEVMRAWPVYSLTKAPGSTRGVGWGLRALVKVWQATGDERFRKSADDLVRSVYETYGKRSESPITGIRYAYVTRYPPHANHIADEDYELPWQLAVAVHGMLLHHAETGSKQSAKIARDISNYMVKYCWNGVAMDEALFVDDHSYVNHKGDNTGVNTWIPSALALAWRDSKKDKKFLNIAKKMVESIPQNWLNPNDYLGYGLQHWWMSYKVIVETGK